MGKLEIRLFNKDVKKVISVSVLSIRKLSSNKIKESSKI